MGHWGGVDWGGSMKWGGVCVMHRRKGRRWVRTGSR